MINTNDKNTTIPWIEKYRPTSLNDIISQNDIIDTLKILIKKRCLPHLLFYGPPGTGKTSTITAVAKELYGEYYSSMVLELNASDDRGIEVVRNRIIKFVTTKCVFFGDSSIDRENIFKLVILDETDAMTSDAQAIMRKVVENYTSNARFCLICNYIQNINPALQSRCTRFRFSPLSKINIKDKIKIISSSENIKITEKAINIIIKKSRGDMRKVINLLQSTHMAYNNVTERNVNKCAGYPQNKQIRIIFNSLIDKNFLDSYNQIYDIMKNYGLSLNDILTEIHDILVDYICYKKQRAKFKVDSLSEKNIMLILDKIRDIEFNQSINTTENIQLSALIAIFSITK